jgi:hypothetical protein
LSTAILAVAVVDRAMGTFACSGIVAKEAQSPDLAYQIAVRLLGLPNLATSFFN